MASAAPVTTALPTQVVVHKDLVEGGKFLKWTEQVRLAKNGTVLGLARTYCI